MSGRNAAPDRGNALYLGDIPLGSTIHAISKCDQEKVRVVARSAGNYATQLMGREGKYAIVKIAFW